MNFDVIIIGGGAAGLSAALWCDDLGLSALLLEKSPELGGQLLWTFNAIKNHLGVEAENGREMQKIFVRQIEDRNFLWKTNAEVSGIDLKNKSVVLANGERFSARTLIIATGVRRKKLGVEGEDEFTGKGILSSGNRDKNQVKNKRVAIVGGGDAALENALILSETAGQVFLVHRRKHFRARGEFIEKVLSNPKIKVLTETVVEKIIGAEAVELVELKNLATNDIFTLQIEAMLIRIGLEPNSQLFRSDLKLDKNGYIEVNGNCETSVENVFAIGDIANPLAPTVSSAVGMGATVAKVIFDKIEREL